MDSTEDRGNSPRHSEVSLLEPTSNAMLDVKFFSSPLDTLLESIHDRDAEYLSIHDLIEAYSAISTRIRSQVDIIMAARQPPPALALLGEHTSSLTRALRRDILRCFVDPSHDLRTTPPPGESFSSDASMTDHEIQYARDLSAVCHYSLRLLSDIFSFKLLYSLFQTQDLEDFLSTVVKVALAPTLPTPNSNKTWSLVFWIIQRQSLSVDILSVHKTGVSKALERALNEEKGHQAKLDALKAIHNLLKSHPQLFISSFSKLFPLTLTHLVSDDADSRLQAAYALSGFALAKLRVSSAFPHQLVIATLDEFVQEQTSKQKFTQGELYLPVIIQAAFASRDIKQCCWACVVLTSVIVLSGASIFSQPHSLKLCISSLESAVAHMYRSIRTLHVHVWKAIVWAFSRLPVSIVGTSLGSGDLKGKQDIRECAFKVAKQELKGGIGISLVAALLGPGTVKPDPIETSDDTSRALVVVRELMAGERHSDPRDGLLLLHRLLGTIGTSDINPAPVWSDSLQPTLGLLDGTILDVRTSDLKIAISDLHKVDVAAVRPLSAQEVVHHWDSLIDLWILYARIELRESAGEFSRELVHIWQSLLLARADLTEGRSQGSTPSPSFTSQIASIAARFLQTPDGPDRQARHLMFVQRLWIVMKNVFSPSRLPAPAEFILATTLKYQFSLVDEHTKVAWCELCAELISVGIPTLLHVLSTRSQSEEGLEVTRQLWTVLAKTWQNPETNGHWENLVSFLLIPFGSWPMSDDEFHLWEGTLRIAISSAHNSDSIPSTAVIERILQWMGETKLKFLISFPKGVSALFSYVTLSDSHVFPIAVLALAEQTLTSHYPPLPENLSHCLGILRRLSQIISSAPSSMQLQAICAVNDSLCRWIADQQNVMLVSEYADLVTHTYCGTLEALQSEKPSLDTLKLISAFLVSVFEHRPPSDAGTLAFNKFWRATYHGIVEYRPFYSEILKACLLGFQDAYGGSIADGLSAYSESQKTHMSTVPDSQPPKPSPDKSLPYDGSHQLLDNPNSATAGVVPPSPSLLSAEHRLERDTPPPGTHTPQAVEARSVDTATPSLPPQGRDTINDQNSPVAKRLPDPNEGGSPSLAPAPHLTKIEIVHPNRKRRKTDSDLISRAHPAQTPVRQSSLGPSSPHESDVHGTQDRKRKRISTWVHSSSVALQDMRLFRDGPRQGVTGSSVSCSSSVQLRSRPSTPSPDEYDSWEAGVSTEDLECWQRELAHSDEQVPETDIEDIANLDEADGSDDGSVDPYGNTFLSPSLTNREPLAQRQAQHRSQTAPMTIPPHTSPDRPPRLRRNTTTSARMHALERAYTIVANDASQIPVEDLVQATGLVNRIHTALNEQIARKLAKGESKAGGEF